MSRGNAADPAGDRVFKAIDDVSRRMLLDRLFERDGQSLGELCEVLPEMTRYGVMNHLRVLEEATLVSTRRQGRHKFHYLNPVPIREIHDRWIAKYAEPRVAFAAGLTARFSQGEPDMDRPAHVYKAYINAPQAEVWKAITDPDMTQQYFYGTRVDSEWKEGGRIDYLQGDGSKASEGTILSIEEGSRIDFTFQAMWDPDLVAEGPCREVWALSELNGMTELTIELYDAGDKTLDDFVNGFPYIVSGMKSLVETGRPLPAPY